MDGAVNRPGLLLGVKMCGNCNPDIPSMEVARRIAQALDAQLVPYDQGEVKLTISACCAACVEEGYPSSASIRGLSLNGRPCRDQAELTAGAVEVLKRYLREHPLKNKT